MTTPPRPFVDMANPMLTQVPAQLDTGSVGTPSGKLGVLTIRTASTTLTVFLTQDDLRTWSGLLTGLADQLGGSIVVASPLDIAAVRGRRGNGRQ
jgi:hypothetical protein